MGRFRDASVAEILGVTEDDERRAGDIMTLALAVVRQNPGGATSKMVAEVTGVSERRARDILKELVMRREIYDRELPGIKTRLYYPNGKLVHKYLQSSKEFGQQIFRLSIHEGIRKPRLQIQERAFSLLEGESVEGAVFIDTDHARELAQFITEAMDAFESFNPKINSEVFTK